jgi:hypothetical protein
MKKVIENQKTDEINIGNVGHRDICATESNGTVYILTKLYNDCDYAFKSINNMESYATGKHSTIRSAIKSMINRGVYVFDSVQELGVWLQNR